MILTFYIAKDDSPLFEANLPVCEMLKAHLGKGFHV